MRGVRTVAAVALVALIGVGCSGSKPNTPGTGNFADATCADLANWATALQAAFTDLQSIGQIDATDTTTAQNQLGRLSSELLAADKATARLSDGISGRGAPDVSSGEQVKQSILDALKQLRDAGAKTRAEIDAFDVKTATKEQSDKLKANLSALSNSVTDTLAGLAPLLTSNDQLRSALQGSATCRSAGSAFFSS